MLLLGIDSGGTSTTCVAADTDFSLQGVGRSGPSRYTAVGVETAQKNVRAALTDAVPADRLEERIVGGFGMGGLDNEADRRRIESFLSDIELVDRHYIENDVVIANEAMFQGGPGIVVVAGTGAIAYGCDADGTSARSSGWGWLIGDEGSGFDAARRGLQAAARAQDGRGPETALLGAAESAFDVETLPDVTDHLHQQIDHPREIAPFAESVVSEATNGDDVATEIVEDCGQELALACKAIDDRIEVGPPVPVGCVGGFGTAEPVADAFARHAEEMIAGATVAPPVTNPAIGGLVMAARHEGIDSETAAIGRLDDAIKQAE
ncbi:BadF/BadG/BcrA/BcrD ATPase family protein [Halorhabdus rudnickae]|uniref:BadF/BadG/BcrA/BcrD ATPase family protein n=1 Tax=Halorhabdus rudnickae TaxID=1775544 RepID=UPI0010830692|nr:BadF/BadG/BcrA/BcrD ATPase family protein [Halorhabdus rudnickae]